MVFLVAWALDMEKAAARFLAAAFGFSLPGNAGIAGITGITGITGVAGFSVKTCCSC
ncbi:MAG: hypothetical protein RL748_3214 [Pseudomonadota bacterium]|jgi:hypothetical protein